MELAGLREEVAFVSVEFRLSERTACKLLGVERSSYRYEPTEHPGSSLDYRTPEEFRQKTGYAHVESKERFPHPHSLDGGCEIISELNQNRETLVING